MEHFLHLKFFFNKFKTGFNFLPNGKKWVANHSVMLPYYSYDISISEWPIFWIRKVRIDYVTKYQSDRLWPSQKLRNGDATKVSGFPESNLLGLIWSIIEFQCPISIV